MIFKRHRLGDALDDVEVLIEAELLDEGLAKEVGDERARGALRAHGRAAVRYR